MKKQTELPERVDVFLGEADALVETRTKAVAGRFTSSAG